MAQAWDKEDEDPGGRRCGAFGPGPTAQVWPLPRRRDGKSRQVLGTRVIFAFLKT